MRLLYFSTGFGPHDHRFLSSLARTEHEVYFLRLIGDGSGSGDFAVPPSIRSVKWRGTRSALRWQEIPRLALELRRLVREIQPDLIHAGPIQTCALIAVLSKSRPVLTMSWGFDLMQDADRSAWSRWVTRFTLRRSAYFVSDARVTRAKAVAIGMRKDRTAVFPWGVDLGVFRPASRPGGAFRPRRAAGRSDRRAPGARRKPFVLLCNRSWEPRYGVDVLARAFVLAASQDDALRLVLLGGGSEGDKIRQILREGRQLDRVRFVGHVPQKALPHWYQRADLFISPSHVDGSSVSLMEALACGSAILVSDIPANKEWIRPGTNGWLFRDGEPADLAQKIRWIRSNPAALPRVRREARRSAVERADWERNFQTLLRSYKRAVAVR